MAGAGYKLFNTGDVLTAAQVNTYLMEQTVMVFADATARTTALSGVVSEGMISYLKDTNAVEVYDGSNWVSSDDPNAIQNTIVDAKGDLITATAADTPSRLAVGANETRLVADSTQATGLKYVADTTNYAIAAKGDLLVGSAADTLAALTVGADHSFLKSLTTATNGVEWSSSWTTYTPHWLSDGTNPSLGNGVVVGAYQRVGKMCAYIIGLNLGSTSARGTGSYRWGLPFAYSTRYDYPTGIGTFYAEDYAVAGYVGIATTVATDSVLCRIPSNTVIGATAPFTWATSDYIWISGVYEVA